MPEAQVLPLSQILLMCIGRRNQIIRRYFNRIERQLIEIILEKFKNNLSEGYCDDIVFECTYFLNLVENVLKMDHDLDFTIEKNKKKIMRFMAEENIQYLKEVIVPLIEDFNIVKMDMMNNINYITKHIKNKLENFKSKFPKIFLKLNPVQFG